MNLFNSLKDINVLFFFFFGSKFINFGIRNKSQRKEKEPVARSALGHGLHVFLSFLGLKLRVLLQNF